jgi:8-oxo-dGTP pyrophosphatase MutT (NUDIX family)
MSAAVRRGEDFTARGFAARVYAHGEAGLDEDRGDHALNPHIPLFDPDRELRDAAVLIPVVDRHPQATVILTQRTAHLRKHSGQIAFPGGSIDADDPSPEHAALRETAEEIGLDASHIDIVGRLPDYRTGSGFRITPVLATVTPVFDLRINPDEVADVFEVPLSFLMNPANHRRESREWEGHERFYYTMPFDNRHIWGVTAGIIRSLYERLYR